MSPRKKAGKRTKKLKTSNLGNTRALRKVFSFRAGVTDKTATN
jgi:hypothetical protein